MRHWTRTGLVAAAGAAAGLAAGFLVWGLEGLRAGFTREYSDGGRVRVGSVIDGDTVVLEDGLHVRYRGCDTPEVYHFVRDPEPFAEAASARNRELVSGAWVTLRLPPASSPAIDAHGRILADLRLERGGNEAPTSVGETLVAEGLARANLQDVRGSDADRLRAAERAAREAKLGMWSGKKPSAPGFVASRNGRCALLGGKGQDHARKQRASTKGAREHVGQDCLPLHQVELLEDHCHLTAQRPQLGALEGGHLLVEDPDPSVGGIEQPVDAPQQRGLARPG